MPGTEDAKAAYFRESNSKPYPAKYIRTVDHAMDCVELELMGGPCDGEHVEAVKSFNKNVGKSWCWISEIERGLRK